ncbi:MAG: hypothetical protein AAGK14_09635 [Verrucomicrobiota bacterium]
MNQRKLKPEVDAWIADGILTPDQGERILACYLGTVFSSEKSIE